MATKNYYWHQDSLGYWFLSPDKSSYPENKYPKPPNNGKTNDEVIMFDDNSNNKIISSNTNKSKSDLSYSDIVDQVQKNNTFSAEQAQKQMDFQERLFNEANQFNRDEAELNRKFQQESADKAMAFSSAENEANRQWQQMMSNTAHQREMADLKAAGLNPILAANNGASAGAGSAAMSASAAGYAASSSGAPSGSKADADQSGTMAIANLLGKMLDNQTEITKMITSAETARETAEMYTGATRYAAELGQIASQYASDNSYAASRYGSDTQSYIAGMNPYNILGNQINEFLSNFNGSTGYSAGNLGSFAKQGAQTLAEKAKSIINKAIKAIDKMKVDRTTSSHTTGKF